MSSPARGAASAATTVRWLLAVGLVVVSGAMPGTAWAYWNSEGTGTGTASVATLPPVPVSAVSPQYSDEVEVSWQAPIVPAGMEIDGYRVVRIVGGTPTPACGATSSAPLPATDLSCVDTGLADGAADYVVTAVVGTWTTTGTTTEPVTVAADRTAPTIRLSGADRVHALIDRRDGEPYLFFRPMDGGSIRIDAELTDDETGPASALFPALSAPGWSHAAETVTTGTGSVPTVTYRSAELTFAPGAAAPPVMEVAGVDARGNSRTRTLAFVSDAEPPTGGALTVNGVAADASGTQSWDAYGTFTVSGITPFVEEESSSAAGLADVTVTRESAALADGACGAFGGASDFGLTAPVEETALPDGCYRYTLSGDDRVGNSAEISTTVRVDTTAPIGGALQANGIDAVPAGSVSITSSGSWSVTRTDYTDPGSGILSSTLTRSEGALIAGACESFGSPSTLSGSPGESSAATGCYRYVLTGINETGLAAELSTTVWVDGTPPTGGALTANGIAATGAGSSSTSTSSTVTLSAVTGFADANAGIDTNEITRTYAPMAAGVCGEFDPASGATVSGTPPFAVTGLADGCHRFTLIGTDLAGNASSISTIVRLDASAPSGGTITINGVAGTPAGATAGSTAGAWTVDWAQFVDPESVVTTSTLAVSRSTLAAGVCSTSWTVLAPITMTGPSGTTAQTGMTASRCYRYVLTGTNAFGLSATLTLIVKYDSSPPGGGVLVVNGRSLTTATPVTTTSITGTFTVAVSTLFSDTVSGMAGNVVSRAVAPVAGSVCGAFGSPVITALTATYSATESGLAPGCYRYVLTGTNGAGGIATRTTTVRVDTTSPVGGTLAISGATLANDGSSYYDTGTFTVVRTNFADPETTLTNTLTRAATTLVDGVCQEPFGPTLTTISNLSQALTTGCYRYVLTGTNALSLAASTSTIVRVDSTVPAGGTFRLNGVLASAAGSTTTVAAAATFQITAFTHYSDPDSGIGTSALTRAFAPSSGGVCGTFGAAGPAISGGPTVTESGLANGCYQYVLTGTNAFGGSTSVKGTIRVGP